MHKKLADNDEICMISPVPEVEERESNKEIKQMLEDFADVVAEPTTLPPVWGVEHQIIVKK